MPGPLKQREDWTLSQLYDALASHSPGDGEYQWASAELQRRQFVAAQEALEQAQHAAINAQIEASEYAKQSLTAMHKTVFWTAVAAISAAVAAGAALLSSLGAWLHH